MVPRTIHQAGSSSGVFAGWIYPGGLRSLDHFFGLYLFPSTVFLSSLLPRPTHNHWIFPNITCIIAARQRLESGIAMLTGSVERLSRST
jgi:hypothetical protein